MMRQLWRDILAHRLVAGLFALCWLGAWVITVVSWAQGGPVGIPLRQQWLFAAVASLIVGWWRVSATTQWSRAQIRDSMRHGLIVAVVLIWLAVLIQPILAVLSGVAYEDPSRPMMWQGVVMLLLFALLVLGLIASVVGMLGGLVGGALAHLFHRWRHRSGPPAPAGVS
jgi:hypothetical protein